MPRIPDDIIDDVRQANDVVEVIGSYIPLKKMGASWKTRCPFHQEKTPSFNVNQSKQIWHCFGCGKGGNVFTFLMEYEKVSFIEAVRTLATRAGITLPAASQEYQPGGHDLLYQANEFAAKFYQQRLASDKGQVAREYIKKRGIEQGTVELFRLGYAPNAWDELIKAAAKEGLSAALLKEAGLIVPNERETSHYDRFRHRIMFPFFSAGGRVIGFGGRSLEETPTAKYLNSSETPIYHKGRGFYGFFQARSAIAEAQTAVLVEGNVDLIVPYQAGFKNLVATAGTALTPEQCKVLSRYAKKVVICYDADKAGQAAAERAVELVLEAGMDARIAIPPAGKDPDQAVREQGIDFFARMIAEAMSFIEFKVMRAREQHDLSQVAEKSDMVNGVLTLLAKVDDPVKRRLYIRELAEAAGLDESFVMDLARKKQGLAPQGPAAGQNDNAAKHPDWEIEIFSILLRRPQLIADTLSKVQALSLISTGLSRTLIKLDHLYKDYGVIDEAKLVEKFEDADAVRMLTEAMAQVKLADDSLDNLAQDQADLDGYIAKLRQQNLKPRLRDLQAQIKEAEGSGDRGAVAALLEEYQALKRETQAKPLKNT
ncbi:MAG TPA: DNA primase [Candidatus Edwardsbacteria bacterium]|nr:DNA primase [Candidatus Edwardsbacteria bacterium]